jgi:hypothetical protein
LRWLYRVPFRRRGDRLVSSAAMIMRLLASTAAPTNNVKRSMRPSMPTRKRCPCLNAADLSQAWRCGVFAAAALRNAGRASCL